MSLILIILIHANCKPRYSVTNTIYNPTFLVKINRGEWLYIYRIIDIQCCNYCHSRSVFPIQISIIHDNISSQVVDKQKQALQGNNGQIDKTCPNQDVINYENWRKLTNFCHFGQINVNSGIFCQLSITLDNFLSIFCSLSRLDSDMFLSIRPLFPCSEGVGHRMTLSIICDTDCLSRVIRKVSIMTLNTIWHQMAY